MLLTTTPTIEGKTIHEYKGLVTAEVIFGAHIGRDLLAGLRDFFGGRSGTYEKLLVEARREVEKELTLRAESMGANAIIGVSFDVEAIGQNGSMLLVVASGTAVHI